ncbi:hypothetical protein MIDIC_240019 [Alphaproteobacteria bacterium]
MILCYVAIIYRKKYNTQVKFLFLQYFCSVSGVIMNIDKLLNVLAVLFLYFCLK